MLLTMGVISSVSFDFGYNKSGAPLPMIFATIMWGANSIEALLAVWLVGRAGVWRSWSGIVRVAVYVSAYVYGTMLKPAVQDWDEETPFRFPGAQWEDYSRPSIDLLTLLMYAWLFLPVVVLFRRRFATNSEAVLLPRRTFSISLLFGWTFLAAAILLWIRFMTWEGVAPPTAYDSMTVRELSKMYLTTYLPGRAVVVGSTMIVIVCLAKKWWLAVVALPMALLVDICGQSCVKYFAGSSVMITGALLYQVCYAFGRTFVVWSAFGLARVMGVWFRPLGLVDDALERGD